ncbi:MAG: amidohydrolase [Deltaproteobacteria bacterium SG8_13]|nr:MAG: amidohydrolase [Deltaproteobacteria bacterium SG8_13]
MEKPFDIVIHGGVVITVNDDSDIIADGLICIRGNRLERIDTCSGTAPLPPAVKTIDARGMIVLPGLVNTHTHTPMTLFRGLADDLPLQQWLEEHIFPAESRHIHPEAVEIGALLACAEMILSGTTTCCDGYFLEDCVARAVLQSGMRAVLGQGVIDMPAPGVPDAADNIAAAERFIARWRNASSRVQPSVFCHAPYTCSSTTLQAAKKSADKAGVRFQIHAAETRTEKERLAEGHSSPVKVLDRLGLLDAGTLLVHCVWLDEGDVEIIAESGAAVAHCPESNMKLASGIAPVIELLAAGVPVGLGTDGCASNNNLDLLQEMDTAAKLHKVHRMDPTAADAATVLRMATSTAATAVGLGKEIGSLAFGKKADLILLDARQPHLIPMYHPISQVVYAAKGSDVHTSIIDGRVVMENRRLSTLNLEQILDRANELGRKIRRTDA